MEQTSTLNRSIGVKKFIVVAACFVNVIMGVGYVITSWSGMLPIIAEEFGWTTVQWGALVGATSVGAAIMASIAGALHDKFSPRKVLIVALIIIGGAMALRGYASNFFLAYIVAVAGGLLSSVIDVGAMKMVTLWFDRDQMYKVTGILFGAGSVGYFIGFNLSLWLSDVLGSWKLQFVVAGAFLAFWGIIWLLFVPERSNSENALDKDLGNDASEKIPLGKALKIIVTSKQAVLCIIAEMTSSSMILTFSTIGPIAFTTFWQCDAAEASFIISTSSLSGIVGYVVLPVIGDKIGRRKPLGAIAIVISSALYCGGLFTEDFTMAVICTMVAGLFNGWGLVVPRMLMLETKEIGGRISGIATGVFITMAKITCALFPSLFTALYMWWGGEVSDMLRSWLLMFVVFGLIGAICVLLTKETGKKALERNGNADM